LVVAPWPTALEAAARIHSEYRARFIRAEVVSYGDFFELRSDSRSRKPAKLRLEGRDYVMQDATHSHPFQGGDR